MRFLVPVMPLMAIVILISGVGMAQQPEGVQVKIPIEQLARDAELIVRGTVGASMVSGQYRLVTIKVRGVIKGRLPRNVKLIKIRTSAAFISSNPIYNVGEDVILFLRRVRGTSVLLYETIGGIQGKYDIRNGYVPLEQMTVEEFIRRIRQAL